MQTLEKGLPIAAHSERKRVQWLRLGELDQVPEFWPGLIAAVTEGDFLGEFAKQIEVSESILRNWIRGNAAREKEYIVAWREGKRARVQRVLESTYKIATQENNAPVTRQEQLKAAEIILKSQDDDQAQRQQFGDITINFVQAKDGKTVEGEVLDQLPR